VLEELAGFASPEPARLCRSGGLLAKAGEAILDAALARVMAPALEIALKGLANLPVR
jgi:hypothetical protein